MQMTAELRDHALGVASAIDPDLMTGEQAAAAIVDLAPAEHALANTLMFLALKVARTDAWRGHGHASAADWLASAVGISVTEAHRLLGTAKKADRLPKTKDAMKKGDLSPDQAGAVADGATADPSAEDDLLGSAANDTNKALREKAARAKAAAEDSDARDRRIRSRRSLRRGTDAEGAFWTYLKGPGVAGPLFESLLRPFEEVMFRQGRTDGIRDSFENRSYDAFFAMLSHFATLSDVAVPAPSAPARTPESPQAAADPTPPSHGAHGTDGSRVDDGPIGPPDHEAEATAPPRGRAPAPRGTTGDEMDPIEDDAHDGSADTVDDHPSASERDQGGAGNRARSGPPVAGTSGMPPPTPASPSAQAPTAWSPPWDPDRTISLPTKLPGGNNVKVIVLVDHAALLRGHTVAGETCEITGVGPISVATAREICLQDPFLAVVVKKGRDVVNVAHHGRGLNVHQRTAIEAGGLRCTNIACNRTIALQVDHGVPYAADPITKLDNSRPLCPTCHPLKTNQGWDLEEGEGPRRFLPPDHPDHPNQTKSRAGSGGPRRAKDRLSEDRYGDRAGTSSSAGGSRSGRGRRSAAGADAGNSRRSPVPPVEDRGDPFPDRPPFSVEQQTLL